jgi:hypothetical protein
MYPAVTVSLACLLIACIIGFLFWSGQRELARRKRKREEDLKRRVKELTGEDFVKGHTSVKDLERLYGKKG